MRDIVRHWNVKVNIYDGNWTQVLETVVKYENDVALCAVWLNERTFNAYDLSRYLDQQCLTMMVPRQKSINIAKIIYLPLSLDMWCGFAIAFVSIAMILYAFSKLGVRLQIYDPRCLPYRELSTAFQEIVNIVTSHGVYNFPSQSSIKMVILSWLIFSFLLDVIYSSRYVSLMISTPLTKAIDTIEEFLKSPLQIGEMLQYFSIANQQSDLKFCNDSICTELAKRIKYEESIKERIQNVQSGRFGYIVTKLSNEYIANVPLTNTLETIPMRLMKGCLMKYFTTLAFSPWSPYVRYFSYKLTRSVELNKKTKFG